MINKLIKLVVFLSIKRKKKKKKNVQAGGFHGRSVIGHYNVRMSSDWPIA